jgi:WD40 repeat protein
VGLYGLDDGSVRLLGYHDHLVNQVVVGPDGDVAATCSSDYTVRLWDLRRGELLRVLRGHADDVEDFAFAGDGVGVSGARDNRILVWDLATGAIRAALDEHDSYVVSVACDAGRIYSAGFDHTLRVWDLASGRLLETFGPFELRTDSVAIDSAGRRVVLGCDDGVVRLFDVERGAMSGEIAAHGSGIKRVAVSPDGDILSAAYDQRIRIWDRDTLQPKAELEDVPAKWERSFTWSLDGTRVFAGTFDGTALEWDARSGRFLQELAAAGERGNACFNRVAGSRSGKVALVSDDGFVRVARLARQAGTFLECVTPRTGRVLMNAVALDEDAGLLAAGSHDQRVHLFRRSGPGFVPVAERHLGEGPLNALVFRRLPDGGRQIFAGCYSGRVVQLDAALEPLRRLHVNAGAVKAVRLHPQRELGVSCCADGVFVAWTFEGEIVQRYLGHTAIINDMDLDSGARRLASVSRDFTLKVWDLDSGRLERTFLLGHRSLKCVAFASPDVVVVGDYWGSLIRVDLNTGAVTRRKLAGNGVSSLARCGDDLVACSYEGSVHLVDPATLEPRQSLRAMEQKPEPVLAA